MACCSDAIFPDRDDGLLDDGIGPAPLRAHPGAEVTHRELFVNECPIGIRLGRMYRRRAREQSSARGAAGVLHDGMAGTMASVGAKGAYA